MIAAQHLDLLNPQQMRQAVMSLLAEVAARDERIQRQEREATFKQALIDKLTHEVAVLRRLKYAAASEKFRAGMSAEQKSLLDETLEADLAALSQEIEQLELGARVLAQEQKKQPRREALPPAAAAPRGAARARQHRVRHPRLRLPDEAHRPG